MKGGPRKEAAKVQRKEVPGLTQLRSKERGSRNDATKVPQKETRRPEGGNAVVHGWPVAQAALQGGVGQEGRPRAGGQGRGAWAAPASKKRVPGGKTCRQRGQPPPRPTRAKGGGWEKHQQKWAGVGGGRGAASSAGGDSRQINQKIQWKQQNP